MCTRRESLLSIAKRRIYRLGPVSKSPFVASGVQMAPRKAEEGVGLVSAGDRRQRGEAAPGRRAAGVGHALRRGLGDRASECRSGRRAVAGDTAPAAFAVRIMGLPGSEP